MQILNILINITFDVYAKNYLLLLTNSTSLWLYYYWRLGYGCIEASMAQIIGENVNMFQDGAYEKPRMHYDALLTRGQILLSNIWDPFHKLSI